jgi:alpha-D-ribose 1-methylphosphonate 5-triphosphate synthase subunit PhnG
MSTVKLHYKNIAADAATYVGEPGSVFFDPATSQLRVGDGVTPGGHAVTLDIGLATHDDATYINNLLFLQQGTGFATGNDSLHVISGKITAMAAGTSLAAVQSSLSTQLSSLATAANLATAQTSLNTINTNTVGLAQATNLATLQSTANNINTNTNSVLGVGFVLGTDDLHAIRQAITALQADITAIKTKVGA